MGGNWDKLVKPNSNMRGMPAKAYNNFVTTAKWAQQQMGPQGQGLRGRQEDTRSVMVQNKSIGGPIEPKSIVGLGDVLISFEDNEDAYNNDMALDVEKPKEEDHGHKWGVVLDGMADADASGRVQTYGPARVLIDMGDEDHKYAEFEDENFENLVSTDDASKAPIFHVESGTGLKEGVVFVRPFVSGFSLTHLCRADFAVVATPTETVYSDWAQFSQPLTLPGSRFSLLLSPVGNTSDKYVVMELIVNGAGPNTDSRALVWIQYGDEDGNIVAQSIGTDRTINKRTLYIAGRVNTGGYMQSTMHSSGPLVPPMLRISDVKPATQARIMVHVSGIGGGAAQFRISDSLGANISLSHTPTALY